MKRALFAVAVVLSLAASASAELILDDSDPANTVTPNVADGILFRGLVDYTPPPTQDVDWSMASFAVDQLTETAVYRWDSDADFDIEQSFRLTEIIDTSALGNAITSLTVTLSTLDGTPIPFLFAANTFSPAFISVAFPMGDNPQVTRIFKGSVSGDSLTTTFTFDTPIAAGADFAIHIPPARGSLDGLTAFKVTHQFAVVPEPATLTMLGLGALGMAVAARRRKHATV